MKAITISQPYASLIADGEKWVENRKWRACPSYRGPLAIHAGKGTQYMSAGDLRGHPTSCIVAVTDLKTAIELDAAHLAMSGLRLPMSWIEDGLSEELFVEFLAHEHTEGPICLVLGNVRKLAKPVHCKGALGLWEVPEHVEAEIRRVMG